MAIRYKQTTLKGQITNTHRKVWILSKGEIPKGYIIHHLDENRFNNDISNLAIMKVDEHNRIHFKGKTSWNKGKSLSKEHIENAKIARKATYIKDCIKTLNIYNDGNTQQQTADLLHISRRQVCDRLRDAKKSAESGVLY